MRWVKRVGLASVLLLGAATYGYGATPGAPVKEPDKASPSLDAVMGKKLISIDGVQLRELDFVDIGEMLDPPGVVPVVIKSLLFS